MRPSPVLLTEGDELASCCDIPDLYRPIVVCGGERNTIRRPGERMTGVEWYPEVGLDKSSACCILDFHFTIFISRSDAFAIEGPYHCVDEAAVFWVQVHISKAALTQQAYQPVIA